MRRLGRPGSLVAGYVWDFAAEASPISLIRKGLIRIGAHPPVISGAEDSRLESLSALFAGGGLTDVAVRVIDVSMSFPDFDDCWCSLTPGYSPTGKAVAALSETDRKRLVEAVRASLPAAADGSVTYSARAHAVKARVPSGE